MTGGEPVPADGAAPAMPALDALTTREAYMAAVRQCFRESGLTYRAVVRRLEDARATGSQRYQPRKENTFQDLVTKGAMPKVWVDDQGLGTLPQLLLALGYSAAQREQWKRAWARIEAAPLSQQQNLPVVIVEPAAPVAPAPVAVAVPDLGGRHEHRRRRMFTVAIPLLLAAMATSGILMAHHLDGAPSSADADPQEWSLQTPDTPGLRDGQCIGITDGRYAFGSANPIVLGLLAALHQQNTIALASPHIDVALNVTLTDPGTRCAPDPSPDPQPGGPGCAADSGTRIPPDNANPTSENVTPGYTELRGALMAQCEYNNTEGHEPKLRILIANAGSAYQYAAELAGREADLADRDPLFAAALGLYQSRQTTLDAERILNAHGIPTVLSAASADTITTSSADQGRPFGDLVRLAATNNRETGRIVTFLTDDLHARKPCLIGSTTGTDLFTTNWTADLRAHWKDTQGHAIPTTTYDASSPTDDVGTELAITPGACGAPGAAHTYDAIVFSGRAQDLQYVLQALAGWGYPPDVPVIGSDDLSNLVANPAPATIGDTDNRKIYFADFGFPTPPQPGAAYYFTPFAESYPHVLGPNTATGHLYAAFNATWLLGESAAAVNTATSGTGITVGGQSMRANISRQIRTTCGHQAIQGATGMISFDANGDAMQQLITINGIDSNGTTIPTGYGDTTDGIPDAAALIQTMTRQTLQCQQN